jgi:Phasin protein
MPDNIKHSDSDQNNGHTKAAASAMWAESRVAGEAARQGAETMQQTTQAAGEALRRGAGATVDVTRQSAEAGVEVMRRASATANETVRRTTQAVVEGQRQIAQQAAKSFEDVSHKVAHAAQDTSDDVRRFMTLPHAAEGGLHDMRQGMAGLIEGVVQTNLRVAQEFLRLSNPVAVVELQQRFAQEYVSTVMQGTATLVRAMRRTADETLHPLEAQIAERKQTGYRSAAE